MTLKWKKSVLERTNGKTVQTGKTIQHVREQKEGGKIKKGEKEEQLGKKRKNQGENQRQTLGKGKNKKWPVATLKVRQTIK